MAGLFKKSSGIWNVNWWLNGEQYNRSTRTRDEDAANGIRLRIERAVWEIEQAYLKIPEGVDAALFVFNGGVAPAEPTAVSDTPMTLGELFDKYSAGLPKGAKEENTLITEKIHKDHLIRLLGSDRAVRSIDLDVIRECYVAKRTDEGVTPYTIKKELKTLRHIWKWGRNRVKTLPDWEIREIKFAKEKNKPKFQEYADIKRQIDRGGLTKDEERELWDAMFLTGQELLELLDHVRQSPGYALIAFAALTGARQKEMIRSQIDDIDFDGELVTIQELKRSNRPTTRTVDLHPLLAEILRGHLANHPGGRFTFCNPDKSPLKPHQCQTLFGIAVRNHEKFGRLTGFHKLRHSFISILASEGVDQRTISHYFGHQTPEQEERYRHLIKKPERPIIKLLPQKSLRLVAQ